MQAPDRSTMALTSLPHSGELGDLDAALKVRLASSHHCELRTTQNWYRTSY